jgi:outer membrane protein OmpA-like peptidoglycan-associated protein
MKTTKKTLPLMLGTLALVGCATVPKPQELLDLEAMRETKEYRRAEEDHPNLIDESKAAQKKATTAWEEEEIDVAKHWATLGTIKVRTALAIMNQKLAREKAEAARKELTQVQQEEEAVAAKIAETDEQLELVAKLNAARRAAKDKEAALKKELSEAQKREEEQKRLAEAQQKVGEAEVALRTAETVDAAQYAKPDYESAQTLLAKAQAALKANKATDATTMADLAKTKAEAATASARPKWQAAKQTAERQARNQALQKDAAGIAGVTVKMKTVGETQQLILPVLDLFKRGKTAPKGEMMATLTAIGELLKKYDDYPVIVNGYTSYRVRSSQRFSVSQARAQAVANLFVSQGVKFKRMAIAGHGAENLVGRRWSTINDRVEVVILFQ